MIIGKYRFECIEGSRKVIRHKIEKMMKKGAHLCYFSPDFTYNGGIWVALLKWAIKPR